MVIHLYKARRQQQEIKKKKHENKKPIIKETSRHKLPIITNTLNVVNASKLYRLSGNILCGSSNYKKKEDRQGETEKFKNKREKRCRKNKRAFNFDMGFVCRYCVDGTHLLAISFAFLSVSLSLSHSACAASAKIA